MIIKNPEIAQQLAECCKLFINTFDTDLLGVYLYGSVVMSGLQKYSDLDLFIVTNRSMTLAERKVCVKSLLQISGLYMKSAKPPLEITVVQKSAINPWHYPPVFDFQYGEWLRESFEKEHFHLWSSDEMPDLALIITQVLLKSHTLFGEDPQTLLATVPAEDFTKAMFHDLDRLYADLKADTRNVLLTLARIWSTLKTRKIRSKPNAADWAILHLPENHQPVMQRAKTICLGLEEEHWNDMLLEIQSCADFILSKIKDRDLEICSKSIELA